mmetsp:Transcript_26530/g.85060  ORF Transcript_26530/g.85060 Transcript_26530/m.85060 type:complete len:221 (-) Transcript_26530:95-757(-)
MLTGPTVATFAKAVPSLVRMEKSSTPMERSWKDDGFRMRTPIDSATVPLPWFGWSSNESIRGSSPPAPLRCSRFTSESWRKWPSSGTCTSTHPATSSSSSDSCTTAALRAWSGPSPSGTAIGPAMVIGTAPPLSSEIRPTSSRPTTPPPCTTSRLACVMLQPKGRGIRWRMPVASTSSELPSPAARPKVSSFNTELPTMVCTADLAISSTNTRAMKARHN